MITSLIIKCHLTTYWVSHNSFSVIILCDHLHNCGTFLACFLMYFIFNTAATIILNRIPNLHIVFSLHAQDVHEVHYWMITTCNIQETIACNPYSPPFKPICVHFVDKNRTESKTVPPTLYIFNGQGSTHTDFHMNICIVTKQKRNKTTRKVNKWLVTRQCFPFPCKNLLVPHVSLQQYMTHCTCRKL